MGPAPMRTHSSTTSTKADSFRRIEVITGVGRHRRWTEEEKAWIVAESLDPATTVSAVARRYGLHASQLFVWRQQLAASGQSLSPKEEEQLTAPIRAKYETEGSPYYATARLWDDGILDPLETRDALGLGIAAALHAPVPRTRFGVFRM